MAVILPAQVSNELATHANLRQACEDSSRNTPTGHGNRRPSLTTFSHTTRRELEADIKDVPVEPDLSALLHVSHDQKVPRREQ